MPLGGFFTSESESISIPTQFQTGFSEVGGAATGINVNIAGKIGKKAQVQPQITLTDQGALAAGAMIAHESLLAADRARDESSRVVTELGGAAFEFADRSGGRAFDLAERATGRALDFAGDTSSRLLSGFNDALSFSDAAARRERDTFADALGLTERVTVGQSDFARALFGDSLAAVSGVLREGQAQLGNTVTNLNAIARQQSTTGDERVQQIARVLVIAGAALAAVLGLAFVAKAAR